MYVYTCRYACNCVLELHRWLLLEHSSINSKHKDLLRHTSNPYLHVVLITLLSVVLGYVWSHITGDTEKPQGLVWGPIDLCPLFPQRLGDCVSYMAKGLATLAIMVVNISIIK